MLTIDVRTVSGHVRYMCLPRKKWGCRDDLIILKYDDFKVEIGSVPSWMWYLKGYGVFKVGKREKQFLNCLKEIMNLRKQTV